MGAGRVHSRMAEVERLSPYSFHERDFESLDELEAWFDWEIPETFNIAAHTCDRWAEATPDETALYRLTESGEPETFTFAEVQERANRFANFLDDRGVGRGDRIAINGTQCLESLAGNLAAYKLGAVAIPLTVLLGTDGLGYRLRDSNPAAFLADEDAIETVRAVRGDVTNLDLTVTYGGFATEDEVPFAEAVADRSGSFETVTTAPDEPAFIVYTSGTTGEPKGVVHGHQHLLGELPQYLSLQCHRTGPEEVTRTVAEWSWIMSLPGMVLPALFYGVPVVGAPSGPFDAAREFELIDRFGITHLNLPPTAVRMMMQVEDPAARYDLSSIQSFSTGGESADQGIIDWVNDTFENASFLEGYGTSEVGGLICDDPAMGYEHRLGSFGIPSVGHEVAILDPETEEPIEEPGAIGELVVRYEGDPSLLLEYLNKPERTEETIRDGWVFTDDLVSRDEDGYYTFHSRADDVIITSGYRVSPNEIEESLLTHEAVQNAGVIGIPHETRGEIPKAFVEPGEGVSADAGLTEELQDHVKERLARYEYPREIEFVEELPKTTTGKIRRQSLREREDIAE